MNFLAHIHLASPNQGLMMGGFIGDGTRKAHFSQLPESWIEGVRLHWHIDTFTDAHPLVNEIIEIFRPSQQKYASVVGDIAMDHFLAKNWSKFSEQPLVDFARDFYALAHQNENLLSPKHQRLLYYMEKDNWLYNYHSLDGLSQAFNGISRKASFSNNMNNALDVVQSHYEKLNQLFFDYYPLVVEEVQRVKS